MAEIKRNKSYQSILAAARTLFWKYGIKRVSVEEISAEAGVSKMTFYRAFKNKNDLVLVLLQDITNTGMERFTSILNSSKTFIEKVEQMILAKHEYAQGISPEFVKDLYAVENTEWQKVMLDYREKAIQLMVEEFTKAQKEGWVRKDLSIEFILYMMEDMQQKVNDERFLHLHGGDLHQAIMEMTKFFFYGIIPEKSHRDE